MLVACAVSLGENGLNMFGAIALRKADTFAVESIFIISTPSSGQSSVRYHNVIWDVDVSVDIARGGDEESEGKGDELSEAMCNQMRSSSTIKHNT